jgi:hypothetical protein
MLSSSVIPNETDWDGYQEDLDCVDFHDIAFGKSNDELQSYFQCRGTLRFDELLRLPRRVFQYYIRGFASFLMTPSAEADSDSASIFLSLLSERERVDAGCVAQVYEYLYNAILFVASNQEYFDADPKIYGSFMRRAEEIDLACKARTT